MIATFLIIFVLILINALYVAAEFSSVSVRRSRVRQRAEEGNALARRLLPYIDDPHRLDRYIAACQIGITVSSLVLGAYGQARLAP
ncbi:MAG TPA: CNNM domain-containing protein, partial [Longimicrobiales bacterium]